MIIVNCQNVRQEILLLASPAKVEGFMPDKTQKLSFSCNDIYLSMKEMACQTIQIAVIFHKGFLSVITFDTMCICRGMKKS